METYLTAKEKGKKTYFHLVLEHVKTKKKSQVKNVAANKIKLLVGHRTIYCTWKNILSKMYLIDVFFILISAVSGILT